MSVHDVWHVMTRMVGLCLLWHLDSNFKENGTFIFSGLGKAIFRTNKSTRANGFNRMFVIRHGFDTKPRDYLEQTSQQELMGLIECYKTWL